MRLLLDTHAILWWLNNDSRLGVRARDLVENPGNDVFVSVVSLWEIVVMVRVGKLQANISEVIGALEAQAFDFLPIQPVHLEKLAELPLHHRDPFDHLLLAQSIAENTIFITDDPYAPLYPAQLVGCSDGLAPSDSTR